MSEFKATYDTVLSDHAWDVILDNDHNILVHGDALSGKTEVLLRKIAYLAQEQNVPFSSMLNICSDSVRCEEALKRYRQIFHDEGELPQFTTLSSLAYRIIKRDCEEKGKPVYKPYKSLDQLIQQLALDKFGVELRYGQLAQLKNKLAYTKQMLLSQKEIDALTVPFLPFPAFYKAYEMAKKRQSLWELHDLIPMAIAILHSNPEILQQLHKKYTYLHIDRAEALSFSAHVFLKALFHEDMSVLMAAALATSQQELGAYPKGLSMFCEAYPNAREVTLAQALMTKEREDVLAVFQGTMSKEEWHGQDDELICKAFADPSRLYHYAKKQVIQNETCVFAYRNSAFALPLLDDLLEMNHGASMEETCRAFFQDVMIQELLGMVGLLLDPKNITCFAQVYKVLDVSEKCAKEVLAMMRDEDMDVFEALIRSSLKAVRKKELMGQMELIRMLPHKDTIVIIKGIITKLGYNKRLAALQVPNDDAHLLVLKILAQRYPDANVFIERMNVLDHAEIEPDSHVKILPIHRLDGKSYERVYVLDCVRSSFPSPYHTLEDEEVLFMNALKHSQHLELFAFRTVYDLRTEISSFIFAVHKRKDEQAKPMIRTVKKLHKISECHLKPHTRIHHETLGAGMIDRIQDGMMHVHFDNQEERSLNIKFCLSNDLIKLC